MVVVTAMRDDGDPRDVVSVARGLPTFAGSRGRGFEVSRGRIFLFFEIGI